MTIVVHLYYAIKGFT